MKTQRLQLYPFTIFADDKHRVSSGGRQHSGPKLTRRRVKILDVRCRTKAFFDAGEPALELTQIVI